MGNKSRFADVARIRHFSSCGEDSKSDLLTMTTTPGKKRPRESAKEVSSGEKRSPTASATPRDVRPRIAVPGKNVRTIRPLGERSLQILKINQEAHDKYRTHLVAQLTRIEMQKREKAIADGNLLAERTALRQRINTTDAKLQTQLTALRRENMVLKSTNAELRAVVKKYKDAITVFGIIGESVDCSDAPVVVETPATESAPVLVQQTCPRYSPARQDPMQYSSVSPPTCSPAITTPVSLPTRTSEITNTRFKPGVIEFGIKVGGLFPHTARHSLPNDPLAPPHQLRSMRRDYLVPVTHKMDQLKRQLNQPGTDTPELKVMLGELLRAISLFEPGNNFVDSVKNVAFLNNEEQTIRRLISSQFRRDQPVRRLLSSQFSRDQPEKDASSLGDKDKADQGTDEDEPTFTLPTDQERKDSDGEKSDRNPTRPDSDDEEDTDDASLSEGEEEEQKDMEVVEKSDGWSKGKIYNARLARRVLRKRFKSPISYRRFKYAMTTGGAIYQRLNKRFPMENPTEKARAFDAEYQKLAVR